MKKNILARYIRFFYIKRMIPLFLLFLFVAFLWMYYPFHQIFFPKDAKNTEDIISFYDEDKIYIKITTPTLYYTGYDYVKHGLVGGSYYYTFIDDKCVIFLLDKGTAGNGALELMNKTTTGKLVKGTYAYKDLLKNLSGDLKWTYKGLKSTTLPIVISEAEYYKTESYLLFAFLCILTIFLSVGVIRSILYVIQPVWSPACLHLRKNRASKELLTKASDEFINQQELSLNTMFITRHYFIELSRYGIAIIPLDRILWVYKHSILSRFLWFRTKLTYTLRIITNHGFTDCPWQCKEDADAVISYLKNCNPDLLVGFSLGNKREVKARKKENQKNHL